MKKIRLMLAELPPNMLHVLPFLSLEKNTPVDVEVSNGGSLPRLADYADKKTNDNGHDGEDDVVVVGYQLRAEQLESWRMAADKLVDGRWFKLLSERELEVLRMYLSGMRVSCIARKTGRDAKTISTQKQSVMRKMNLKNDVELAIFAILHGLV